MRPTLALILLGHGSRDPQWAEPFERLRGRVRDRRPDAIVELAYLDHLEPDLAGAVESATRAGATRVSVVPVFLGLGGHVRRDVPALVQALRERFPAAEIAVAAAIGDDDEVIDALAAYCARVASGEKGER